jgi:hypothetical protein
MYCCTALLWWQHQSWILWICLAMCTSYDAPRYTTILALLSFQTSLIQIFSSDLCSQTLSIYICPARDQVSYWYITKGKKLTGSWLNGIKHYQNSASSYFTPEASLNLLLLSPNTVKPRSSIPWHIVFLDPFIQFLWSLNKCLFT